MPFHRAHLYWKFLYNLYTVYIFVKNEWYKMATTIAVDYNRKGSLLEELAGLKEPAERKTRLFEVIDGIESILATQYADGLNGVIKLEQRLAQRMSFTKKDLEILSRGVKEPLQRGLDDLEGYNRDIVNEVFIVLYGLLVDEIKTRPLDGIVDHSRQDDANAELAELMYQIEIYHVYSTWVNQNIRPIKGLDQQERDKASKQFRDLKKSAVGFMSAFRSLLWQDNNIASVYALFGGSKTLENYNTAVDVLDRTIADCEEIVLQSSSSIGGNGWSAMTKLTHTIRLNAEYHFLKMSYSMLHDDNAMKQLQDTEQFKQSVMDRAKNMRYLHVLRVNEIPTALRLSSEVREFYEALKPR